MVHSLEELIENRKSLIEAHEKNNFTDGIHSLLTDLYPDTAHFIYELLQNAEDMDATIARFILNNDGIDFEHNGTKRDFNLSDIDAITNIGHNAQKKEDTTSIGKFGVGFKAVFSYTNTPEIHSGKYHFRIKDYFVPSTENVSIRPTKDADGASWTKFYFPFDNPKKPIHTAFQEVLAGLTALDETAILFLRNIQKIEYLLPDASLGYVEYHKNHDGILVAKTKSHDDKRESLSYWLRFQEEISMLDSHENMKDFSIGIAYKTEFDPKTNHHQIVSVPEGGKTFIYFPADKEHSGLRFHINAPFASTVARDSVRNCKENTMLIKKVAGLVAKSIDEIKTKDMLNLSFFDVLPNEKDSLPFFYQWIFDFIYNTFQKNEYLPTKDGSFVSAPHGVSGSAALSDLIDNKNISYLFGTDKKWISNANQRNSRIAYFIEGLEVDKFTPAMFFNCFANEHTAYMEFLLEHATDEWLKKFYLYCADQKDELSRNNSLRKLTNSKIIRDTKNKMYMPKDIYMLSKENKLTQDETIPIIKLLFYNSTNSKNKSIQRLFEDDFNIQIYDKQVKIQKFIEKLNATKNLDDQYFKNLLELAQYFATHSNELNDYKIKAFAFEKNDKIYLTDATSLVIGPPYENNDIKIAAKIYEKQYLWKEYKNRYSEEDLNIFLSFVEASGAFTKLAITKQSVYTHPLYATKLSSSAKNNGRGQNDDYTIENLELLLKSKDRHVYKLLWQAIFDAGNTSVGWLYTKASYSPNASAPTKNCDSSLIYYLKQYPWILDKKGVYRRPGDVSEKNIHKSHPFPKNNHIFQALGFGSDFNKVNEEQLKLERLAKECGQILIDAKYSEQVQEFLHQLKKAEQRQKKNPQFNSVDELLQKQTKNKLPYQDVDDDFSSSIVKNKKYVEENISHTFKHAKNETSVLRNLYYKTQDSSKEEKNTLYTWYHGYCQMCNTTIRGHDGKYHFEAKNIIDTRDLTYQEKQTIHIAWNSLGLCPNCAMKYTVCEKDISTLYQQLLDATIIEDSTMPMSLDIQLNGQKQSIFYTPAHFLALQKAMILLDEKYQNKES